MSDVSPRVKRLVWHTGALLLTTATLVVLYYVGRFLLPVLLPFLLALLISLFIEPLVRLLERRAKFPRGLAVLASIFFIIAVVGFAVALGTAQLVNELIILSRTSADSIRALQGTIENLVDKVVTVYVNLPPEAVSYIDQAINEIGRLLQTGLNTALNVTLGFFSGLPGAFFIALVTLLATYFFSRDMRAIRDSWVRLLPGHYGEGTIEVGREAFKAFRAYLRAQLVLVSITTVVTITGLAVIGSPYAVSLGLLTGFFDLIPVLGPSTVFIPWIIYVLFTGPLIFAVKLAVVYAVVLVLRQLLEAKVIATSLGVHPLAVLAGMFIGLKVLGVAGLVLGPVIIIIVQAAVKAGLTSVKTR